MTARCMRCREKKEVKAITLAKTSRGGFIIKGQCTTCDCNVAKIVSKDTAKELSESLKIALPG